MIKAAAMGIPLVSSRPRQYATSTQIDAAKMTSTQHEYGRGDGAASADGDTDHIADGDEEELKRRKWVTAHRTSARPVTKLTNIESQGDGCGRDPHNRERSRAVPQVEKKQTRGPNNQTLQRGIARHHR